MSIKTRIERAERLVRNQGVMPSVSILREIGGAWQLDFSLWDGKQGSGRTISSTHDTEGEAWAHYDALLKRYPAKLAPTLIIDDLGIYA